MELISSLVLAFALVFGYSCTKSQVPTPHVNWEVVPFSLKADWNIESDGWDLNGPSQPLQAEPCHKCGAVEAAYDDR